VINACVANIGPRERRKRIIGGVVMLAVAVALVVTVSGPWRPIIFVPLCLAGVGFFQAQQQTCIALVALGAMNMDTGTQPVTDPAALAQMRAQARTVLVRSVLSAAVLTALVLLLPI
jgi:uncharacterized membrane protein